MERDVTAEVRTAYRYWAPIYDVVCGEIFANARRAAVEASEGFGSRILEIGVGTGLSFKYYRRTDIDLVGIDLSWEMLKKAQRRVRSAPNPFVGGLINADAHRLPFRAAVFDCTLSQFMITLVANPELVLEECVRVTRPRGAIVVVSHLTSTQSRSFLRGAAVQSVARRLGLRPGFARERLLRWAQNRQDVTPFKYRQVGAHTLLISTKHR